MATKIVTMAIVTAAIVAVAVEIVGIAKPQQSSPLPQSAPFLAKSISPSRSSRLCCRDRRRYCRSRNHQATTVIAVAAVGAVAVEVVEIEAATIVAVIAIVAIDVESVEIAKLQQSTPLSQSPPLGLGFGFWSSRVEIVQDRGIDLVVLLFPTSSAYWVLFSYRRAQSVCSKEDRREARKSSNFA